MKAAVSGWIKIPIIDYYTIYVSIHHIYILDYYDSYFWYIDLYIYIPVVPHKAVAEVSE